MYQIAVNRWRFRPIIARYAWFTLGWITLVLGAIGIALPLLPTTPFIILSAFAFGRSSRRLQNWLINNRTFAPIITDWRESSAIAPRYKAVSITMMVAPFGGSSSIGVASLALIAQGVCMAGAATFILSRPSPPGADPRRPLR